VPFSRTEPNVPAYEEDPNSPFTATNTTSKTFALANPANDLLILSDPRTLGQNRLRVNGDTGSNYRVVESDDSFTNGLDAFQVPDGSERASLVLRGRSGAIGMSVTSASGTASRPDGGSNFATNGPIDQFTLFNTFGQTRDVRLRVFTLDI